MFNVSPRNRCARE